MTTTRRSHTMGFAALLAAALTSAQCSNSASPTGPTSTVAVSGVGLTPSSSAAGTTVRGVVNLTTAAGAGGAQVSLSSSNTAVATVPTPVLVPAGATSVAFNVTATSPGAAVITATMNGAGSSSTLTVIAGAALSSVALDAGTVLGGEGVTGTVTLTQDAGSGGAVVALASRDPAAVPPSVTVPQGLRTGTFAVTTRAVGGAIATTVTGSFAGVSKSAALTVMPVAAPSAAVAAFGVSGTDITDTCVMTSGGGSLECTFDGSLSKAPGTIVAWEWSYTVATTMTQTTTGPVLSMPAANCSLLPPPPLAAGATSFPLTVRLKVRDNLGNVSAETVNDGARVLPGGTCGF